MIEAPTFGEMPVCGVAISWVRKFCASQRRQVIRSQMSRHSFCRNFSFTTDVNPYYLKKILITKPLCNLLVPYRICLGYWIALGLRSQCKISFFKEDHRHVIFKRYSTRFYLWHYTFNLPYTSFSY